MPDLIKRLSLAVILLLLASSALAEVRVILYHRVGDARYPSTNVTVEGFRSQMEWLRDAGYTVVTTREIEHHLLAGRSLPDKAVAIQFDDGFKSVSDNASPILKEFGYPYTIFLPTEAIDQGWNDYMGWKTVEALRRDGVEFGAHGYKHLRLSRRAEGEGHGAYVKRLREELDRSSKALSAHGIAPDWVAYPYGEVNEALKEAARAAGFKLGFAQDPGAFASGFDPFTLPRFALVGGMAEFNLFKERMSYLPLKLEKLTPARGFLESAAPAGYGAVVVDGDSFGGAANMFVSELGRKDADFDRSDSSISAKGGEELSRRVNRVIISLRDKKTGRYALGSWAIIK